MSVKAAWLYNSGALSQPKASDVRNNINKKTDSSPCFHGNKNRLEPHLVAISVLARRGRKKFMSEGEKDKYFLQCKAERKGSQITLESD